MDMYAELDDFAVEQRYEDTSEPFEKIGIEANGGWDINGEWEFSGSYSVRVEPNDVGNYYAYSGRIQKFKRKGRWNVQLSVIGGGHSIRRIEASILNKSAPSIKKARKLILQTILEYEMTSHFKEQIAPQIYDEDYRTPILKEVNGELFWIASTYADPWYAIQGKLGYSFEKPLGHGEFCYRQRKWERAYPRREDGTKDYDGELERIYSEPFYGRINVSGFGMGSGSEQSEQGKFKINQAIFDVNDRQTMFKQMIRYQDL